MSFVASASPSPSLQSPFHQSQSVLQHQPQHQSQQEQQQQQQEPISAADNNHQSSSSNSSTTTTSPKKKSPRASMASSLPNSPDRPAGTTSSKLKMMEAFADDPHAMMEAVDMDELQRLASLTPTPLKLGDMYKYAASTDPHQRLRNAQFLYRELPIRLAQRAHDLLSLPHGLSKESTPIRQVALMYIHYIHQYQEAAYPETPEDEDRFTQLLHSMVLDRSTIPTTIAKGLAQWSMESDNNATNNSNTNDEASLHEEEYELDRQQEMEDALQRFFTARVGLRFLTEHHILSAPSNHPTFYNYVDADEVVEQMHGPLSTSAGIGSSSSSSDTAGGDGEKQSNASTTTLKKGTEDRGCIQHDCNAVLECQKVAKDVARQTYDCYGICPEIEIVDRQSRTNEGVAFTYVPHHLHYMLAELLKNSCRSSVERYMKEGGTKSSTAKMPPVRVVMVKGKNEMTIKVSDQGGGIPRSKMTRIFKFTHSTAKQDFEQDTEFGTVEAGIRHMRGFGLPLARIYARYFGGELTLKSMEGYGLDAYLYLPRLGEACENLPRRVVSSPGEQVSLPSAKKNTKGSAQQQPKGSDNKASALKAAA